MNDDITRELIREMQAQNAVLMVIAESLEKIAQAAAPTSPNFKRPLSEYPGFDWRNIDARPIRKDQQGVSQVEWGGQTWTRRSGSGKYGKAIWFSRAIGRGGDETRYARLITFKDYSEPEPIAFEPGQRQPDHRRDNRPMPQAQAIAAAAQGDGGDLEYIADLATAPKSRPQPQGEPMSELTARDSFYAIVGEAIRTGKVHAEKANEIVKNINQMGYAWGVQELQAQMAA